MERVILWFLPLLATLELPSFKRLAFSWSWNRRTSWLFWFVTIRVYTVSQFYVDWFNISDHIILFWFAFHHCVCKVIVAAACRAVHAYWVFYSGWCLRHDLVALISLLLFVFHSLFMVLLQLAGHLVCQWLQLRHVWLHLADYAWACVGSCVGFCPWSQVSRLVFKTLVHKVAGSHVPDTVRRVMKI